MSAPEGLIFAWRLGPDMAAALDADDVAARDPDDGPLWVHLDRRHPAVRPWLEEHARLDSLVATVFLPLTFVTGLPGINVGGIPGADTGWAFLAVCALLAALLVFEVVLFRRWHWTD